MVGFHFSSCSSSDDEEVIEEQKKFNVVGKWMTLATQPLEDMDFKEAKKFATSFQTPFIEFSADGKMRWFEFDPTTNEPIKTEYQGIYSIKDDKITVNALGNKWMSGTHIVESVEEGVMEWTVETNFGKGRFYFVPTVYTNL